MGEQGAGLGRTIDRANGEDAFPPAQVLDPQAVAAQVAIAGVAQAAGVRMHDADDGQPPIGLANDTAGEGLAFTVEPDVGDAGIAAGPSGERGQHHRLVGVAQTQQQPTGLLVAAIPDAVLGELLE